ncbi:MAG: DUF1073 domain-containing protein [Bradyrhizobium sp.]|nr:DUF1073 domain-containing protein [Bradyrhizobium sp.]
MGIWNTNPDTGSQATLGFGSSTSSQLQLLLTAEDIEPGSDPSYQLCKVIYAYHPLGGKMVDAPVSLAQSLPRTITIPDSPEEELVEAFEREWAKLGKIGATRLIANVMRTSRIYGIASLVVGTRDANPEEPLDLWTLDKADLYFNVLDPLNTAGALTLNQDPNSPEYQKPQAIRSGPQVYHPSRAVILMNEEPLYIEWTNSAFGFVGRSVYQRALFPLKSYVQSMITDDVVTTKAGLLVAKLKSPSSPIDNLTRVFAAGKRAVIKSAASGNVLQLGIDENLESLDLKNLKDAAEFARNNILKNIATAANMPAVILNQETMAEGFGEGTEDAKQVARYIDGVRLDMQPVYDFFDRIVMHRAWNDDFYKSIQRKYPDWYGDVEYQTAFMDWQNAFAPEWPNLLVEPDSEAVKRDAQIMESGIGVAEILMPALDPDNKARLAGWLADMMNARKMLVSSPLDLDLDALAAYTPPQPTQEPETRAAYDV